MTALTPLLKLRGLSVSFTTEGQRIEAVRDASLEIGHGEAVAIVGESGSGKSTLSRALLGLLPSGKSLQMRGELEMDGRPVPLEDVARLRGREIAMVFQDPLSSLDPLMRIGAQIGEAVRLHHPSVSPEDRAGELLDMVKLPERVRDNFPHEISGGMRQRAMLAIALACKARLLVADEPTTALDVTTQKEMLDLIRSVREQLAMSLLLITHDLGIVTTLCTRLYVMLQGRFIEDGSVASVFARPQHEYSRSLLTAARAISEDTSLRRPIVGDAQAEALLRMRGVSKTFRLHRGGAYQALRNVDLAVRAGETLALVGESGSGKSTLARVALALTVPDAGDVWLAGQSIHNASAGELRRARTTLQPVFQDAGAAFNPRRTVFEILRQAILAGPDRPADLRAETIRLLDQVGLTSGESFLGRRPHELSGGQRQRLGIARALAVKPSLIVADEPLSGADVSTRARIIQLLIELQEATGIAYVFITHDIFLARSFAHRVAVMHGGEIVEEGSAEQVIFRPHHPYSRRLVAATLTVGHGPPPTTLPFPSVPSLG